MFVKMYQSMYDGTLARKGPWEALVTFQQFLILCDHHGVVDIHPEVISRRTLIPLEIIEKGIVELCKPDPESRRDEEEGRRLVPIDPNRSWGWKIVNYAHYRGLRDTDERRAYQRNYMKEKRAKERLAKQSKETPSNPEDTPRQTAKRVLAFLNESTGKKFQEVEANIKPIVSRLKDFDEKTLRSIIVLKCEQWAKDEKMCEYLRPATLFNATNCAQYAGELV